MIIDGTGLVMGRLATYVAEEVMKGKNIAVVNADKIIVSGTKEFLMQRYKKRLDAQVKTNPLKGPKFPRMPDRILRRAVRNMLPWKSKRGREAYKKMEAYIGVPEQYSGSKLSKPRQAIKEIKGAKMELGALSKLLGAKW